MRKLSLLGFAVTCAAMLSFAACGDDEDTNGTGGTGGTGGNGGTAGSAGDNGSDSGSAAAEVVDCPSTVAATVQATGSIESFAFTPSTASISAGSVVKFENSTDAEHTATSWSGSGTPGPDGTWDTGDIEPDASICVQFNVTGTYPFFCVYHSTMQGTITVQ